MWVGFWAVDFVPSPKSQLQPTTLPPGSLLASVKAHARPVQLAVNDATGGGLVVAPSVTLCDVEPLPPLLSVTVRLTVYVPLAV